MKRTVSLAVGALTGALLLTGAPAAFADSTPPPPRQHVAGAVRPIADVQAATKQDRRDARRAVNDAFKVAIDEAKAKFKAAMASATTAAAKAAAQANRRADVASAIAARQTALSALAAQAVKPPMPQALAGKPKPR